jgi:cytochrome c biogenesis protein CcmG/thiol:disulfide interchange protein DsbE
MASTKTKLRFIIGVMLWSVLLCFMGYVMWARLFNPHGAHLVGHQRYNIATTAIEGYAPIPDFWQVMQHDVVLLNFFATWCTPCQAEHPLLIELSKKYQLQVVGVASRDSARNVAAFLEKKGNPYSYLGIDLMDATAATYQVKGLPESYLIKKDGTVLAYHSGSLTQAVIEEKFLPYLTPISDAE